MVTTAPLLALRHVAKRFPNGTQALVDASLSVAAGEVHGLLGANGAGKSTLIAILSGALEATGGSIEWRGAPVAWRRPIDARRGGVATIYQHVALVPTLSALENILLDQPGRWRRDPAARARAATIVARLGHPFALDSLAGDLPIGTRQMVSIAQALSGGADLVVMDEPTASLAAADRAAVYRVVRQLAREEGKAVLFVSHFLDEILSLTDRVTVLRDGRDVLCCATAALDERALATAISGREVVRLGRRMARGEGAIVLAARGLASPGTLAPTDLDLRAGEITGVAGLLGSGRSELLLALFGADPAARGEIMHDGQAIEPGTDMAVAAGIALVPEDRKRQGLVGSLSISDNIALPDASGWLVDRAAERGRAEEAIALLDIKTDDALAPVETLSGGNAQKVLIAKWLAPGTRVLMLDEPTAGIDIGARVEILHLVRQLADQGMAILLVTDDFADLIAMSDRLLVMRDGVVVATPDPATTTETDLTLLAGGSAAHGAGAIA